VETVLKEHVNVKKVVLVGAIMQKKIANVETARQEIVIAINMPHNIKKRDLVFYQISFFLFSLT